MKKFLQFCKLSESDDGYDDVTYCVIKHEELEYALFGILSIKAVPEGYRVYFENGIVYLITTPSVTITLKRCTRSYAGHVLDNYNTGSRIVIDGFNI